MRTFCTIITSNYFPYAATLYQSIIRLHKDEKLTILVIDDGSIHPGHQNYGGIEIIRIDKIYNYRNADALFNKYASKNSDALRWALKSVLISYLLENGYSKVIYADSDLFFFNNYDFLFDELEAVSILLTPGRTTRNYRINEEEFLSQFRYGLFNAGFIGATNKGIPALHWWSDVCLYKVETNFELGLFVDQKYLDALHVHFEGVHIVKHFGCNIAIWNQHECQRTLNKGVVVINGHDPIIFIHFTNKYIPEILDGNDPLILPLYREYERTFNLSGHKISGFINLPEYKEPNPFIKFKKKLLIRTRIKRWLFLLSEQL
jgi:hypothetical protein